MRPTKNLLGRKQIFLFCLCYTSIVTILFLLPGKKLPATKLPLDKVVHTLVNAGLFFFWILCGLAFSKGKKRKVLVLIIAGLCILYGIIIEVLQETLVPLRQADIWDVVANAVGIILGIIVFYKIDYTFKKES